MELQHLDVKIPIAIPSYDSTGLEVFIHIFHRWIQEGACEELLIDVRMEIT